MEFLNHVELWSPTECLNHVDGRSLVGHSESCGTLRRSESFVFFSIRMS